MKNIRKLRTRRSRKAMSEVLGVVMLMAVTIAIGFATWMWARGAAQSSENDYGNAVSSNIGYLAENFNLVNANFSSTEVTIWFYNYGNMTVYIKQVWVSNVTNAASEPLSYTTTTLSSSLNSNCNSNCLVVPVDSVANVTVTPGVTFNSAATYQIKAIGLHGNSVSYYQLG